MRLRVIIIVLSLFAVLSAAAGGVYYFFSLMEHEHSVARRQAAARVDMVQNQLSSYLSENLNTVKALAGLRELRDALERRGEHSLEEANWVLDHFKKTLEVDVCYLMDRQGKVLASSNRHDADSFVGQNFAFRPYFKQAIKGGAGKYLALGMTSKKRGAYYGYPILGGASGSPLGVVVIKAPIRVLEKNLISGFDGITLLTGPFDMIFSSSRPDWIFKTLWKRSPKDLSQVKQSRQFGEGPWSWVGLRPEGRDLAVDLSGQWFMVHSLSLEGYPGWKVVHLVSLQTISESVWKPMAKATGVLVLGLCLFTGLSVYFLLRKASGEIAHREAAENDLRLAKEKLSHYSKDLERQVMLRSREITGLLKHIPAVVYVKDRDGKYVMVNSRWEELFGLANNQVQGKTLYDVFEPEMADQFRSKDLRVLRDKRPYQVEERFAFRNRVHNHLTVRFPVLDEEGEVTRLCGISVDITDMKKAQDQLRQLSGSIMASQEKERTAIARELHDELGQVLTALRMDAVQVREFLKGNDPKAQARADNMCRLIDKTISDVRHIVTRLRPPVLDDLGLVDALEWHTTEFEKQTSIACVFNHFDVPEVSAFTAIAAYRVAQEALTNVARHSGATSVDVVLRRNDSMLEVAVVDNGRGFEIQNLSEQKGLGIAGMRERASLAGGNLEIISRPGAGTEVYLRLPLWGLTGGAV